MTYRLFTTAEDVLTALINCLLQKNDGSKNRVRMTVSVLGFIISIYNQLYAHVMYVCMRV